MDASGAAPAANVNQALNTMHFISAIPKLTGQNYVLWRKELDAALALVEIHLAL